MKQLLFILALIISSVAYGQSTYYLRADTIVLQKVGGNTTFKIENSTRTKTGAYLRNYSGGRTDFSYAVDSGSISGSNLVLWRGGGTQNVTIGLAGVATPTWQQTLTAGSILNQANTVDAGSFQLNFNNIGLGSAWKFRNGAAYNRIYSNVGANDSTGFMFKSEPTSSSKQAILFSRHNASVESQIIVRASEINLNAHQGALFADTLLTYAPATHLMSWENTGQGQIGVATVGTGLSFSGGVLNVTGIGGRFGVSGEDATAAQHRSFVHSGFNYEIAATNGTKRQLIRSIDDSSMVFGIRTPGGTTLNELFVQGADSSIALYAGPGLTRALLVRPGHTRFTGLASSANADDSMLVVDVSSGDVGYRAIPSGGVATVNSAAQYAIPYYSTNPTGTTLSGASGTALNTNGIGFTVTQGANVSVLPFTDGIFYFRNTISTNNGLVAEGGSFSITNSAGTALNNGAFVFNDGGTAVNFRMESDGDANNFFSDGTNNRIGIGTGSPAANYKMDVNGDVTVTASNARAGVKNTLYKVYTALLTQSGTSAPTATVLENTLGGTIVWTRNDVGDYTATLSGAFTVSKTWLMINYSGGTVGANSLNRNDTNSLSLFTLDADSTPSDDRLGEVAIEIRVYY